MPHNYTEHPIKWDDAKVSRLWNYYSRTPPYSEMYFSKVFGDRILRQSGLPFNQTLNVLDFGCGPGFIWDHLQKLGIRWNYAGVDFASDSVATVNQKATGHPQFKGVEHITHLPTNLPPSSFDVVLLIEVVEHLKDEYLDSTLSEVARLLKPNGMVLITTPNEENLAISHKFCPECGAIFHQWQHVQTWSVTSLTERLRSFGFKPEMIKTLNFSAQDPLRKLVRLARMILGSSAVNPHMIATFQKNSFIN